MTSMKVTTDACLFGAWAAAQLKNENIRSVLDIGTGTGLLSLMLAQECNCSIDAVEIEPGAAAEAEENVRSSPWKERINIIASNVTTLPLKKYDCIISNPPFYEGDLKAPSSGKNIAHHSEVLKMEQLSVIIKNCLLPGAVFFLLIPYRRKEEVLALIEGEGLFAEEIVEVFHSPNHPASRVMIKGRNIKSSFGEKGIFIKGEDGSYFNQFIDLLKNYYLNY